MHTSIAARLGLALSLIAAGSAFPQCADTPPYDAPDHELIGANIGDAVALSADGTIALVGAPVFDSGDGLVRSFERQGGVWVEGEAFRAGTFEGEGFGSSIAMNDAGDLAVIGHPFDLTPVPFVFLSGAASVWERDAGTGTWSRVHTFYDPSPGFRYGFGASVAVTPDGSTAVISRAAQIGTKTDALPDEVYVATRDGDGAWSALETLPNPAPNNEDQFGEHVAINASGDTIAVGAPLNTFSPGATGEIYIFRKSNGVWTNTETIAYRDPDAAFSLFGSTFAFDGDTLIAADPGPSLFSFDPDLSGELFLYDGSDGAFGPVEDERIGVPESLRPDGFGGVQPARALGYGLAVRGGHMLVGASYESSPFVSSEAGTVYRLARAGDGWRFVSRLVAEDPVGFARFGDAVAISESGDEYLIGEPFYEPNFDLFGMGRVHFTGEAFRGTRFTIQPSSTLLTLQANFPGLPLQFLSVEVEGTIDAQVPVSCDPGDPIRQIELQGGSLRTIG